MWQMTKLHSENVEMTSNLHKKTSENLMKQKDTKHIKQSHLCAIIFYNKYMTIHYKCMSSVIKSTSANSNLNAASLRQWHTLLR
jgi:hypothetical protein